MRVYLDHNATSPLLPEALEAMRPFLEAGAANASSAHREGQRARLAIEDAREEVAALAGAAPSEVVFTSGGTEADNAAIQGAVAAVFAPGTFAFPSGARAVSTTLEHPAVHRVFRELEARGLHVVRVAPGGNGVVDTAEVLAAASTGTILVSVMHVNNEIGTIQPIGEIAETCAARGILLHSDAVQALGRIRIPSRVPLVSLSSHKIGGPQGVGALIVRKGSRLEPILRGGPQEMRRRAGTENVAGIVGFGAAARLARERLEPYPSRVGRLRDRLESSVRQLAPGVLFHGGDAPRVANTSCFSLPRAEGTSLQIALDLAGFAVSTGTACASGKTAPSYVLRALELPEAVARGALRVSLGWTTTVQEVDRFVEALMAAARDCGLEVGDSASVIHELGGPTLAIARSVDAGAEPSAVAPGASRTASKQDARS